MTRAQANLVALAVALVLLTAAVGVALAATSGAFVAADSEPRDRAAARGVADRLVAAGGPLADRPNVLNASVVADLDAGALHAAVPATRNRAVRVTLNGSVVAETGDAAGGATVRRVVLLERTEAFTRRPALGQNGTLRLAPTASATVRLDAAANVTALWAAGRQVRHDPAGLVGTFDLALDRAGPTRLRVNGTGPVPPGAMTVTTRPWSTETAVLAVTVDG